MENQVVRRLFNFPLESVVYIGRSQTRRELGILFRCRGVIQSKTDCLAEGYFSSHSIFRDGRRLFLFEVSPALCEVAPTQAEFILSLRRRTFSCFSFLNLLARVFVHFRQGASFAAYH